jgi:TolC family type I secretion outer membrane protein
MITAQRLTLLAACAFSVTGLFSAQVVADSHSDTFQPDAFRTEKTLRNDTAGLADPRGRSCPLPAAALSLSVAVDLALCRNPGTRSAWASAQAQAAALGSTESAWLPTVTGTGSESRVYGEHVDVNGNNVSTPQNTGDAAITLSWTIYDFGARSSRVKSAHRLLDAAAATVSSVAQQTVLAVVESYYGVVAADAMLLAAKATEDAGARSLDVARALRAGGVTSLADVLQAETAYDEAVLTRVQSEAAAKSSHGALAVVIGAPADQPLRLDAEAVPAEVPMLNARMADLMAEAARQRPDLAAALAQRDAAEANVSMARATGRPSISFQAGRNFADTTGTANQRYDQVGIYITFPIFNGFSTAYGVRQAQALLESSEANADEVRLNVSLGVWNAYYSLESGNQQLAATATLTKTAADNSQVALGRYQSGVGTIIDVLTAQAAAATARQLRITAEYGWQVARAQLALALGRLSGTEPLSTNSTLP